MKSDEKSRADFNLANGEGSSKEVTLPAGQVKNEVSAAAEPRTGAATRRDPEAHWSSSSEQQNNPPLSEAQIAALDDELDAVFSGDDGGEIPDTAHKVLLAQTDSGSEPVDANGDDAPEATEDASGEESAGAGTGAMAAAAIGMIGAGLAGGSSSSSSGSGASSSATDENRIDAETEELEIDSSGIVEVTDIPSDPITVKTLAGVDQVTFEFSDEASDGTLVLDADSVLRGAVTIDGGTLNVQNADVSAVESFRANSGIEIRPFQLSELIDKDDFSIGSDSEEPSSVNLVFLDDDDVASYNGLLESGGIQVVGEGNEAFAFDNAPIDPDVFDGDLAAADSAVESILQSRLPGEPQIFSFKTALAKDEKNDLPDEYSIDFSSGSDLGQQAIDSIEDSLSAAETLIDNAANKEELEGEEDIVDQDGSLELSELLTWVVQDAESNIESYLDRADGPPLVIRDAASVRVDSKGAKSLLDSDIGFGSNGGLIITYGDDRETIDEDKDERLTAAELADALDNFDFVSAFEGLAPTEGFEIGGEEFLSVALSDAVDRTGDSEITGKDGGVVQVRLFPEPVDDTDSFDLSGVSENLSLRGLITGRADESGEVNLTGLSDEDIDQFERLEEIRFDPGFSDGNVLVGTFETLSGKKITDALDASSARNVGVRIEGVTSEQLEDLDTSQILDTSDSGTLTVELDESSEPIDLSADGLNLSTVDEFVVPTDTTAVIDAAEFGAANDPVKITGAGDVEVVNLGTDAVDLSLIDVGDVSAELAPLEGLGSYGSGPNFIEDDLLFPNGTGINGAIAALQYTDENYGKEIDELYELSDDLVLAFDETGDYSDAAQALELKADAYDQLFEKAQSEEMGETLKSFWIARLADEGGGVLFETSGTGSTYADVETYADGDDFTEALREAAESPEGAPVVVMGASTLELSVLDDLFSDLGEDSSSNELIGNPNLPPKYADLDELGVGQNAITKSFAELTLSPKTDLGKASLSLSAEQRLSLSAEQADGAEITDDETGSFEVKVDDDYSQSLHATVYINNGQDTDRDYSGIESETYIDFGTQGEPIVFSEDFKMSSSTVNLTGSATLDLTNVSDLATDEIYVADQVELIMTEAQSENVEIQAFGAEITIKEATRETNFDVTGGNLDIQLADDVSVAEASPSADNFSFGDDGSRYFKSAKVEGEDFEELKLTVEDESYVDRIDLGVMSLADSASFLAALDTEDTGESPNLEIYGDNFDSLILAGDPDGAGEEFRAPVTTTKDFSGIKLMDSDAPVEIAVAGSADVTGTSGDEVFKVNDSLETDSKLNGGEGFDAVVFGEDQGDVLKSETVTADMMDTSFTSIERFFLEGDGTEVTFDGSQLSEEGYDFVSMNDRAGERQDETGSGPEGQTVIVEASSGSTDLSSLSFETLQSGELAFFWDGDEDTFEVNATDDDDEIIGPDVSATINGGAGEDTITGGAGADVLTGGNGGDTFRLAPGEGGGSLEESISDNNELKSVFDGPVDEITDFVFGQDSLEFTSDDITTESVSTLDEFATADDDGVGISFGVYDEEALTFTTPEKGNELGDAELVDAEDGQDVLVYFDDPKTLDTGGIENITSSWVVLTAPTDTGGEVIDDPTV